MGFLEKQQQVFGYKLLKLPSHMHSVKANVLSHTLGIAPLD